MRAKACEDKLVRLAAAGQIVFALASAELDSASFPTLDKLADAAKTCPDMHIEVSGHASCRGHRRAQSAAVGQARAIRGSLSGARPAWMRTQLEPVGYGATRPVAPNDTDENMAKNRRIEFTVRPK